MKLIGERSLFPDTFNPVTNSQTCLFIYNCITIIADNCAQSDACVSFGELGCAFVNGRNTRDFFIIIQGREERSNNYGGIRIFYREAFLGRSISNYRCEFVVRRGADG